MIEIEIDGKKIEVAQGTMIIEAADQVGIKIPRFCYHKKLSIAANCRMCLVEVEKSRKPLPACATPITAGMVVHTQSKEALVAQKAVMEFLLINHPLDCPICDQGGECELQDVAMGYGRSVSQYTEGKRSVHDKNIGSLIATDMTRCIQCTRCVRFGDEIAGVRELGATGRGEHTEIGTYIDHSLKSELSGNVIDICPVGALTSKPFRFRARAWELEQGETIAPHDGVGSNLYAHRLRQTVMRVVPREKESINETWISDRDRFSYEGLSSADRVRTPWIKQDGEWIEVDWPTALQFTVEGLQKVNHAYGPGQLAALASPSSTVEEFYLLQKLWRELGSHNVDHRLRQTDFSDDLIAPMAPGFSESFSDLEMQDAVLLIGADPKQEQPMLGHRVRKAFLRGAVVMAINPIDYAFNFTVSQKAIVKPSHLVTVLAGIANALLANNNDAQFNEVKSQLGRSKPTANEVGMAASLAEAGTKTLILGAVALHHPQAALIKALSRLIARLTGGAIGEMENGANARGAWLAGAIPHRFPGGMPVEQPGFDLAKSWQQTLRAYLLMNFEPELDCADPKMAMAALTGADFVVSMTTFEGNAKAYANVILPIAPFTETSGTFVNLMGDWQTFAGVTAPLEQTKPAWKVLRVLGNLMNLPGFDYDSSQQVRDELTQIIAQAGPAEAAGPAELLSIARLKLLATSTNEVEQISEWPLYRVDSLVRRAPSLQECGGSERFAMRIAPTVAARFGFTDDDEISLYTHGKPISLRLIVDARIADGCVRLPRGFPQTANLGEIFAAIDLQGGK